MASVIKVYKESLPSQRLIGRRYSDDDRGPDGSFADVWDRWFAEGRFEVLKGLSVTQAEGKLENAGAESELPCVAYMRFVGERFEYWIGMLFPAGTLVPDGYMSMDLGPAEFGVCWIHGRDETGELYGPAAFEMCLAEVEKAGWRMADDAWCFERYHPVRFGTPDEAGKVILDFGIQI